MSETINCPLELWDGLRQTIQVLSTNPYITPLAAGVVKTVLSNMDACKESQFKGIILCPK